MRSGGGTFPAFLAGSRTSWRYRAWSNSLAGGITRYGASRFVYLGLGQSSGLQLYVELLSRLELDGLHAEQPGLVHPERDVYGGVLWQRRQSRDEAVANLVVVGRLAGSDRSRLFPDLDADRDLIRVHGAELLRVRSGRQWQVGLQDVNDLEGQLLVIIWEFVAWLAVHHLDPEGARHNRGDLLAGQQADLVRGDAQVLCDLLDLGVGNRRLRFLSCFAGQLELDRLDEREQSRSFGHGLIRIM